MGSSFRPSAMDVYCSGICIKMFYLGCLMRLGSGGGGTLGGIQSVGSGLWGGGNKQK